ncbi:hypothetical protein K501DRAFT_201513 [Backusella circina FSU 941]|nr:hypothetical protein K501DRAFT_201513 [Backusella circina FSU 941]
MHIRNGNTTPTPTPSTSWTTEMSALAEKIRDDVTNSLKNNKQQANIDRHSISQGMKLVSIAADEYESGNESTALEIYLTGIDKIIMALPNKADVNTRMAIRDKLASVEERVGILNLSKRYPNNSIKGNDNNTVEEHNNTAIPITSFLLSKLTSTIGNMITRAYQSTSNQEVEDKKRIHTPLNSALTVAETTGQGVNGDPITRFKKFGQCVIDVAVSCAILIKQSPIPDILALLFGYTLQLFMWIDAHYHVTEKVQDIGIQCIKFGLKTDEQYRLHEFISEALYMLVAAGLKAAIAFKETPRYNEDAGRREAVSEPRYIDNTSTVCLPATTQKTQTSWLWFS